MSTPPRPAASASDARRQLDELDALLQRMLALPVNPDDEFVRDVPPPGGGPGHPDAPWPANTYPAAYMVVQTSGPQDLAPREPDPPEHVPGLVPDAVPQGQGEGGETDHPFEPPADDPAVPDDQPTPPAAPADEESWVPFRSSWQPSPLTWQPLAESWQQSRASSPAGPPPPAPPEPTFGPSPDAAATIPGPPAAPLPPAAAPSAPPPAGWLLPLVWLNRGFDACLSPWGPPGRWLCGPAGKTFLGALGLLSLAGAAALLVAEGFGWTR